MEWEWVSNLQLLSFPRNRSVRNQRKLLYFPHLRHLLPGFLPNQLQSFLRNRWKEEEFSLAPHWPVPRERLELILGEIQGKNSSFFYIWGIFSLDFSQNQLQSLPRNRSVRNQRKFLCFPHLRHFLPGFLPVSRTFGAHQEQMKIKQRIHKPGICAEQTPFCPSLVQLFGFPFHTLENQTAKCTQEFWLEGNTGTEKPWKEVTSKKL